MQATLLTIIFIMLAAFFKAVADTVADHFDISVFKWKDRRFWDKSVSWKYARMLKRTKYKVDAWHIAGSGMIVSFCLAILFHRPVIEWYYELPAMGVVFNLTFNIFYNKLLLKK